MVAHRGTLASSERWALCFVLKDADVLRTSYYMFAIYSRKMAAQSAVVAVYCSSTAAEQQTAGSQGVPFGDRGQHGVRTTYTVYRATGLHCLIHSDDSIEKANQDIENILKAETHVNDKNASAGNRTRSVRMASGHFTIKPLMLLTTAMYKNQYICVNNNI